MSDQHSTHQSLADSKIENKIVVNSDSLQALLSIYLVFLFSKCFFFQLDCWPNRGHLNSLNDFLSSASALHDPAEWQSILIPFHKGKEPLIAASGQFVFAPAHNIRHLTLS